MKAILRLAVGMSVAVLSACVTSYGPESYWNRGGYSEARLGPGAWQVWFSGNQRVSGDRSEDFALLRAAELCLADNKPFMRASQFKTDLLHVGNFPGRISRNPPLANSQLETNAGVNYRPGSYTVKPGNAILWPRSALRVECLGEQAGEALDAAAVTARIRALYKIGERRAPNEKIVRPQRRNM
jgi:hypothetical protein